MNMMHSDNELLKRMNYAKEHNPFQVPEGYFNNFPQRMMQRIHDQRQEEQNKTTCHSQQNLRHSKITLNSRLIRRFGAAAAIVGIFFLTWTTISEHRQSDTPAPNTPLFATEQDLEATDELLDYTMLRNSDIEYYLTVAE